MIRHLFKLIWNRKSTNFLMTLEIFFSFIVLFGVSSLLISYAQNYKKPIGFEYENVWLLDFYAHETPDTEKRERLTQLLNRLEALKRVEHVALGGSNGPYTGNYWTSGLTRQGKDVYSNVISVQSDGFKDVMGLKMAEGRWFNESDAFSNQDPIIITKEVKQRLFGDEPVIGGKVSFGHTREKQNDFRTVIGVVEAYKPRGEMDENASSHFLRTALTDTAARVENMIYIRVKDGTSPVYEEEVMKVADAVAPGWIINLRPLKDLRTTYLKKELLPFVALLILSAFLIINVALGLYGVLWQSINKRYSEIGLRRALGASSGDIYRQFLGEIIVLATFGLLLGCFFALQFPLLGVFNLEPEVYLIAIAVSVLFIYLLVVLCALYPSRQAATIHPAVALHEE